MDKIRTYWKTRIELEHLEHFLQSFLTANLACFNSWDQWRFIIKTVQEWERKLSSGQGPVLAVKTQTFKCLYQTENNMGERCWNSIDTDLEAFCDWTKMSWFCLKKKWTLNSISQRSLSLGFIPVGRKMQFEMLIIDAKWTCASLLNSQDTNP